MAFNKALYKRLIIALLAICLVVFLLNSVLDRRIEKIVRLKNFHESDEAFKASAQSPYIRQNGKYWIFYNYVRARYKFHSNESITYTTHGEYTFLDNLEPLIVRWHAPISIALYACGSDFEATLNSIRFLRSCSSVASLIEDFVTFHIFFHEDHMPEYMPKTQEEILQSIDCLQLATFFKQTKQKTNVTYREKNELLYPINVARNIARHEATTYYVFPLDIELFPSVNFVREFLEMVNSMKLAKRRSVFVAGIFEMQTGYNLPNSKTELQKMLLKDIAIPFHASFAMSNHAIPHLQEWINASEPKHMTVFKVVNRTTDGWEPFYVTINKEEPYFDEHFSWEGQYDKRIQADLLTILNYDFILLDKAFLMHRQGIKVYHEPDPKTAVLRLSMEDNARKIYRTHLWKLYGGIKFKEIAGEFIEDNAEIIQKFPYEKEEVIRANVTLRKDTDVVEKILDDFVNLPVESSKERFAEEKQMFDENNIKLEGPLKGYAEASKDKKEEQERKVQLAEEINGNEEEDIDYIESQEMDNAKNNRI